MFPDRVTTSYYDVNSAQVAAEYKEVIDDATARYFPFPLVLLDGKLVMAGDIDVYGITYLIKQKLEHQPG